MALAIGEDERFGTGKGALTVSKPLLAIPALPRIARVGDRFEAGVVVHAKDPAALGGTPVEVSAEATGGVALSGPATKSVRLPDGRAQEVRFAFVGKSATPATLRFTVRGAGERDAVEQAIVVAPSAAPEVVATYGDTETERTEAIVPPQRVRPDAGGLELTLASTAMAGFEGAMRQLVDVPLRLRRAARVAARAVRRAATDPEGLRPRAHRRRGPGEAARARGRVVQSLAGARREHAGSAGELGGACDESGRDRRGDDRCAGEPAARGRRFPLLAGQP